MLEKTYSTFHASNVLLQQQYRVKGFTKYSDLISCLLVAEQNNKLLMKNHESRPPGSSPFPEFNATTYSFGRGRGRGRGRGNQVRNNYPCKQGKSNYNPKFVKKGKKVEKDKKGQKNVKKIYYRCGMKGQWSSTCHTPKHLAGLYKASRKEKGKIAKANLAFQNEGPEYNPSDMTYLDASDFYEIP
ncbi:uncharacterized protein LOC141660171 [Apium graveolens]|uniref:uncharacterized protein LOC141660171 n=1 Tax=Apium graveolens TaxID=4045 RepID=UPI003D7AD4EC